MVMVIIIKNKIDLVLLDFVDGVLFLKRLPVASPSFVFSDGTLSLDSVHSKIINAP